MAKYKIVDVYAAAVIAYRAANNDANYVNFKSNNFIRRCNSYEASINKDFNENDSQYYNAETVEHVAFAALDARCESILFSNLEAY